MGPELSAAARIVWNAGLGMAVGAVASLAAIGFVDLVLLLNEWLLISPRSRFMHEDRSLLLVATICVPAAGGALRRARAPLPRSRGSRPRPVRRHPRRAGARRPYAGPDPASCPPSRAWCPSGREPRSASTVRSPTSERPLGSLAARLNRHTERTASVWVGCGVAAAIATAFNAPLAGIVFAHEVILRHYSLRAFAPITVAATIGHVIANVVFERPPLFSGGSPGRRRRAGVPRVHPHRGRRRVRRRCLHAGDPPLGKDRQPAAGRGTSQADAGRRIARGRRDRDARHPRHRQGGAALCGHRARVRAPGARAPAGRQDPRHRAGASGSDSRAAC